MYMCVCVYSCVWVYVCVYICVYVYLCVCVCMYVYMYVYLCICLYVCTCVRSTSGCICLPQNSLSHCPETVPTLQEGQVGPRPGSLLCVPCQTSPWVTKPGSQVSLGGANLCRQSKGRVKVGATVKDQMLQVEAGRGEQEEHGHFEVTRVTVTEVRLPAG